jgi:hypothetical protein
VYCNITVLTHEYTYLQGSGVGTLQQINPSEEELPHLWLHFCLKCTVGVNKITAVITGQPVIQVLCQVSTKSSNKNKILQHHENINDLAAATA